MLCRKVGVFRQREEGKDFKQRGNCLQRHGNMNQQALLFKKLRVIPLGSCDPVILWGDLTHRPESLGLFDHSKNG